MSANLAEMYGMPNFAQHMQSMVSTQSVVTIAIYISHGVHDTGNIDVYVYTAMYL